VSIEDQIADAAAEAAGEAIAEAREADHAADVEARLAAVEAAQAAILAGLGDLTSSVTRLAGETADAIEALEEGLDDVAEAVEDEPEPAPAPEPEGDEDVVTEDMSQAETPEAPEASEPERAPKRGHMMFKKIRE
jgi:hypothetical protein